MEKIKRTKKKEYPSASILNNNRVVFNIKEKLQLNCWINYNYKIWIRFVGTHAEI
jgi:mRNA interferase HigB